MRSIVRLAALSLAFAPFACGVDARDVDADPVQPYGNDVPGGNGMAATSPAAPDAPAAPPPTGNNPPPTGNNPPPAGNGSEAPPPVAQLPAAEPTPAPAESGEATTPESGETPAPPPEEPPVVAGPVVPASDLPPAGAAGVPVPAGAAANLRVLNWAGFKAAISYTFDDSNQSQIDHYAELQALGVPLTFYLQTNKQQNMSPIWMQAVRDGHELGNHTMTHQSTGPNIAADTDAATNFIQSRFGVTVYTMAAPNGSTAYSPIAQTRFLINRGVNDQRIAPNDNTDPFNLPCFIPPTGASTAMFNAKVDAIRSTGTWQTVLVHGFPGSNDGAFQPVDINQFTAGVRYAKAFGDVWIDTLLSVAAYWRAQKTFMGATPVPANGATTWTWRLPDHFPPDQYLRVTVDGGKLRQGDASLVWDDHGYYEVALDLGTLTLSP
jgi:peptidoglycan/xylan/chitin deacetylase (PgdA/CDA1 family)